jgi:glycosyltransferase involved in cell wall biosynthesis
LEEKNLNRLTSLSVFFPSYNEEPNVKRMVDAFRGVLPQVAEDYEIIIVNDGSQDKTGEVADQLAKEDPKVRAVHHEENLGYGAAVRSGIKASTKEYLFFTDGDGQFDVSQLSLLVPLVPQYDGVIGFRLNRQDPWIRKLNAWAWNRLVRLLLGLKVRDIDCAFKLFYRKVFEGIELESSGAMVSTEMLVKIKDKGYKLQEVGVLHSPGVAGKQTGANLRVILRAFRELFRFYGKVKEARTKR